MNDGELRFDDDMLESELEEGLLDDMNIDSGDDEVESGELVEDDDGIIESDDFDSGIHEGALVDSSELLDDDDEDENQLQDIHSGYISDYGSIVIQEDNEDDENGFKIEYIDIQNIAITKRIRGVHSVDGLVQSVKSTGLLKPIVVAPTSTKDVYVLLDGLRRLQACARAGRKKIACIINKNVTTSEIPIVEAMYNHSQQYTIKEKIDYIDYLETQKGIMSPAMIEYLLQMNSGDYTKLKDILNDNDDDIVEKLYDGVYDIATAFRKLEQRRKKESAEEKENKKAAAVYNDEEASGADKIAGSGEEVDGDGGELTEEQLSALAINADDLDEDIDESSLNDMIEEDKNLEGFQPHKQKVGMREHIDPIIKKSVMTRDKSTCQCCKRGGQQYVDILDYHHIIPVYLGGVDVVDNGIMLCVACHRLVHLYATDDLNIDKALLEGSYDDLKDEDKEHYENEEIFEDEKRRFKRIIKLGSVIRKGIAAKGMNKEEFKKEHSNAGIGRRKPGVNAEQEKS